MRSIISLIVNRGGGVVVRSEKIIGVDEGTIKLSMDEVRDLIPYSLFIIPILYPLSINIGLRPNPQEVPAHFPTPL